LAEEKEDIHDAGSVLSIIREARLYRYRYTTPKAPVDSSAPERVGFVIGKGYVPPPACVLAEDGNGVALYAMTSVCWRGLQELLARVTALEGR